MKNQLFTVYIEQDEDGAFIGSIPAVGSCYVNGILQHLVFEILKPTEFLQISWV